MELWFEIKVRGILGNYEWDDKEVTILGREVRWDKKEMEYEADPKHPRLFLEHFGLDKATKFNFIMGIKGTGKTGWTVKKWMRRRLRS